MSRTPILYDLDCGFCRVGLAIVLAFDRRRVLRPVALQSSEAERLLVGMPEEKRMASWHLVDAAGEVHSGGSAFAPMFRLLPGLGALAKVAERFPRAAERGYRLVADNRSALGRLIPDAARRRADATIRRRA